MKLNLERPIAFIDLETTGVNVAKDRIVEIAVLKIHPDGQKEVKVKRVNPEMSIPTQSSDIHGITDEDVKDCPTFKQLAKSLFILLNDCDVAGFNSINFDIPLLTEEFMRAGIRFDVNEKNHIDVQNIFHKKEQRTLIAGYNFYCGKELENAHSAEADILATYEILEAQLEKYDDLENDMKSLHEFSQRRKHADVAGRIGMNDKGKEVFNFGKHKNIPVEDVFKKEPGYYGWLMNGDFPLYTKEIFKDIWERSRN
ncbi:MAG: DNA polymerase III subunit epsilon [Crocinitomicaceae bacterium]|nr:DNA polymerase III subunit epsilon [Crocinitomicaceae bacterium]|tara:strand:+ start:25570 stop:26334 length:765 start_codon:yes stop_codon:yes gene_type:complete